MSSNVVSARVVTHEGADRGRAGPGPTDASFGSSWTRRFFVGGASARWLLVASAIPLLVSVWLLVAPGVLFSREMTWDLLFNLAGAWHLQNGHVPYVDFHDPLGPLVFQLTRFGFFLVGTRPLAFLAGELIVALWMLVVAVLAVRHRLPPFPALVFVLYVVLLAVMPASAGDQSRAYSFAMSYNRWGWGALATLCLVLFVAPHRNRPGAWLDAALGGLLLLFLFYLKITFAVAGGAAVAFAVLAMRHVRTAWRTWLTVLGMVLAVAAAPGNHAYFGATGRAATSDYVRDVEGGRMIAFLMNNRAEFTIYASAVLLLIWLWLRGWARLETVIGAAAILCLGAFVLATNAQAGNVPVGIVVMLLIYDALRRPHAEARDFRSADRMVALTAVLVWPLFSVAAEMATIVSYSYAASRVSGVTRLETTNLRGPAVPADDPTLADTLARTGYRLAGPLGPFPQRSPITAGHYLQTLTEASALFEGGARGRPRILVLDQVNPMPFMLGYPPPRGGNLWLWRATPVRSVEEVFGEVDVVLVPKYATEAQSTIFALTEYGAHLNTAFPVREETPSWSVLSRAPSAARP